MTLLTTNPPTLSASTRHYNFLSIGARGVGKTVFFVGHYADRLPSSLSSPNSQNSPLWFNCDDSETQETIDKIRHYIAQNGEYPPATMKITNFDFQVQQEQGKQSQPLCHVCWWDTPGESCQLYNPAFLTMLLNVNGSCLFLDAQRLVKFADDPDALQAQRQPIEDLAEILHRNGLNYPIAIIVTKCDLLEDGKDWAILEQCLRPLIQHLDGLNIRYRLFYSEIPIVNTTEGANLQLIGKDNALIWLIEELQSTPAAAPIETVVNQTKPIKTKSKLTEIKERLIAAFSQKRTVIASFILMTTVLSLASVLLVERAVNSEQEHPNVVSVNSKQ